MDKLISCMRRRTQFVFATQLVLALSGVAHSADLKKVQTQRASTITCPGCQITPLGFVRVSARPSRESSAYEFLAWEKATQKNSRLNIPWEFLSGNHSSNTHFSSIGNVLLAVGETDLARTTASLRTWTYRDGRLQKGPPRPFGHTYLWAKELEPIGDYVISKDQDDKDRTIFVHQFPVFDDGTVQVINHNNWYPNISLHTVSQPLKGPAYYSHLVQGLVSLKDQAVFKIVIPPGTGPYPPGGVGEVVWANSENVLARSGSILGVGSYDADGDVAEWVLYELPAGFAGSSTLFVRDSIVWVFKQSGDELLLFKTDLHFTQSPVPKLPAGGIMHPLSAFESIHATTSYGIAVDKTFMRAWQYSTKAGWQSNPEQAVFREQGESSGLYWALSDDDRLLLSEDLRNWWNPNLPKGFNGNQRSIILTRVDKTVLLANGTDLYRSKDNGKSFVTGTLGDKQPYSGYRTIDGIYLDQLQPRRAVALSGEKTFISENSGKDWTEQPDRKVVSPKGNAPKRYHSFGRNGIFSHNGFSFDEGATWQLGDAESFGWLESFSFDVSSATIVLGEDKKLGLYSVDETASTLRKIADFDTNLKIRSVSLRPTGGWLVGWVGGFGILSLHDDEVCLDQITGGLKTKAIACRTVGAAERGVELLEALLAKQLDRARALLKVKTDTERTTSDGSTPLIVAAMKGYVDIVSELLDKGANKNATDKQGATALILSAAAGKLEVVKVLVGAGADVNASVQGKTALSLARAWKHDDVVQVLIQAGARE